MAKSSGAVRIGPITLFTLVSVICLAVLAVLMVTTGNAVHVMAQRQGASTSDEYLLEATAQTFLSGVDADISQAGAAGTRQSEADSVQSGLDALVKKAQGSDVSCTATVSDGTVVASFATQSGRRLDVEIDLGDSGTYTIGKWQMTTDQTDEGTGMSLWSPTTG